ncbi:molybdenum cofactor guanylyltransferase [Arthrobacter psychrolactophilus]
MPEEKIDEWLTTARHGGEAVAVQEDPPFAEPAAGLAAGLGALRGPAEFVLVLACDMPHAGDLMRLLYEGLDAGEPGQGVMASADGRKQPLAAIYPRAALQEAVAEARAAHRLENASVFSLIAKVNTKECVVPAELAADIDTWADARAQGIAADPATAEGQ